MSSIRLARDGLIGIAYGIGESVREIPAALVQLPKTVSKLLEQAGDILITLFKDPAKLAKDFARLPEAFALLYQALNNRWEWLKSLPSDKQAFEIGCISGRIEAALIVLKAGPAAGGAAGEVVTDLLSIVSTDADVAVIQLVNLQAQLQVAGAAAGAFTSVAMATGPQGLGGGSSKDKPPKSPSRKPQAGDIISYGEGSNPRNSSARKSCRISG